MTSVFAKAASPFYKYITSRCGIPNFLVGSGCCIHGKPEEWEFLDVAVDTLTPAVGTLF